MKNRKISRKYSLLLFATMLGAMLLISCNRDFPNNLRKEFPEDTSNIKEGQRKVLYLIFDGVRGEVLESLKPANFNILRRNAVISYNSLADYQDSQITNAAGWSNMLIGVDNTKHKVTSEDFAGADLENYKSVFSRLLQEKPDFNTVSIVSSPAFNTFLGKEAKKKLDVANDEAVKNAIINELKQENIDFVLGQFHSADLAAATSGYVSTNADYAKAISNLDAYLGAIVKQLEARPTYAKEDWLVVVASNKGGEAAGGGSSDLGAFSDSRRNSFVMFYNTKFIGQQFSKPDAGSLPFVGFAPNLTGLNTNRNLIRANDISVANFGTSGDFTLMFKVRFNNVLGSYPAFMGTQTLFNNSTNGWVFFVNSGEGWNFKIRNTTQLPANAARKIFDGLWHTIAIQISSSGTQRYMQAFQDGVVVGAKTLFSANATSTQALTLGNVDGTGSAIDLLLRDIAVYNIAIPDSEIPQIVRKSGVKPTDKYYANLQAYFPLDEEKGIDFKDLTNKTTGMKYVTGGAAFTSFSELSKNVSPAVSQEIYKASMNNVDIPMQIYAWLKIQPSKAWGLDGKVWKLLYADLRN